NPAILSEPGMDKDAVFVATCLAAVFGSTFAGLYANYPLAMAPGMGLNVFFAFGIVKGMGHSWETALGAVFLSGILFLIVSLTRIREWVIDRASIPQDGRRCRTRSRCNFNRPDFLFRRRVRQYRSTGGNCTQGRARSVRMASCPELVAP
ncbi:MAG: solute carrier family 23 protein, partial [Hyphomicrobiaceae bacterium]